MDHPEYYDLVEVSDASAKLVAVPWAMLAKAGAMELGKYAAGKLLSSVLKESTLTKADVAKIIAAAVDEIKRHITRSLTEQTILEVRGKVSGCLDLLSQFSESPEHPHRLYEADTQAQYAVSILEAVGSQGITAYVYAVNVKLLCVAVLRKHLNIEGEVRNFERIYRQAVAFIEINIREIRSSLESRIAKVGIIKDDYFELSYGSGDMGGVIQTWSSEFTDSGRKYSFSSRKSAKDARFKAESERAKIISFYKKSVADFELTVTKPTADVIKQWSVAMDHIRKNEK
ncbi:hypothetical protein [Cellvibrio sp. KY-YJ-3]|uniref:hypothetical protein n=1 Tax=Cellvibrio sp. KY-YJ-3 TaxID=454662 RepID=UPI00124934C8|nr:hypothetical protein [Cellvibrio sp. KY-YJ-3]QEY12893.1 hypothetical protein D0B88_11890 [Cellvibrio sp. KY-YJ-3]